MHVRSALAAALLCAGAWLVDVSSPSSPKLLSHYDSVEQATGIEIAGNLMFIGQRGTVQMADFADPTKPNLLWCEETKGYPENPVFHAGRLLVPCGYQGLLIQK